jgi:hypothetical protein
VDLHRKCIKNSRKDWVAGKPQPADKEIPKDNNFSVPRGRDLLIKQGSQRPERRTRPSRIPESS